MRGFTNISVRQGVHRRDGLEGGRFDCVISNGVINLAPTRPVYFEEADRLLRRGGRLAIADIVTEIPLPEEGRLQRGSLGRVHRRGCRNQAQDGAGIGRVGLAIERIEENRAVSVSSRRAPAARRTSGA